MTALNAAILFNNSTGSDTTASGSSAGANVYGSGASTTSASAVVTGITTTGVQAGDLLWVQSSSGRQFSVIASVDSGTQVTCDDTFANTESSRTWAIGGKRATFDNADSRLLFTTDGSWGFILETETDQLITSQIYRGNSRPFILVRGSGNTLKTLTASGDFTLLSQGQSSSMTVYNLKFVGAANNSNTSNFAAGGGYMRIRNCRFGDPNQNTNYLNAVRASNYDSQISIENSELFGQGASVSNGFGLKSQYYASRGVNARNCFIKDFYYGAYSNTDSFQLTNCIVTNATIGMMSDRYLVYADGCIFHNISSHAIRLHSAPSSTYSTYWPVSPSYLYFFGRNIFSNISGDVFNGDNLTTGPDETEYGFREDFTCYLHNSSGFTGITFPSVTLTADPFVDAANGDFNISDSAGGGATLRANNFSLNTNTAVYPFRQYVSDAFGSGGGGAVLHPLRSN